MRIYISVILSFTFVNTVYSQATISNTPGLELKALEEKFNQTFILNRAKADSISKITHQPLRFEGTNGDVAEFTGFDKNGQMLFNKTLNVGSGRTISTNKVWPGGTTGTSLTGSGLPGRLGEWDGSGVLTTHQELTGRVTQVDGSSASIAHSSHVAGTMIATGITANAKGMSYQANLSAYDWNNDEGEMINAAGNGMLLSNHSYGSICGWYSNASTGREEWYGDVNISTTIDYKYGFYDQQASEWDNIAYTNPYYLICKAAGNDRGSAYSGTHYYQSSPGNWVSSTATRNTVGPYDCMEPKATAKNVLTVGAVNKINNSNTNNGWTQVSDVVMSSFSAWGPTDDGRIKPDVVAAGVSIYSCSNTGNTAYMTSQGTSMATPAVCSSLLLVQQHYKNLKGVFMRAATLKGLAIHTADEAGNAGPDYTYGWGLVNISKAVIHISDTSYSQIQENSLANGATYNQAINSDGTKPMRITISWTDIAGTPIAPALNNPAKMLVNDLDIRLTRKSDNVVFKPYILDPASPSTAATTGDNVLDNVEQIYLAAPVAGTYTITVSHKGTLSSPQNYSLLISGLGFPPVASFSQNSNLICTGQSVIFTDKSFGNPTSRKWYFTGGTPSTSTAASASVAYSTAGKYPVALTVTNSLGVDSTYQFGVVSVGGLTLPFTETFESTSSTLALWTKNTPVNDTPWRVVTVAGTTPGNKAYCMPFFTYGGTTGQRDGLITPALSFTGLSAVNLTFQHAYTRYNNTNTDSLIVYISTNCGNTWTRLTAKGENGTGTFATAPDSTFFSANSFTPASAANWCGGLKGAACTNIDLSAYKGMSNIKIKFESYNKAGNNLYIDNVNITGTYNNPVAGFSVSKTSSCAFDPISFYDTSQNIVSAWQWDFSGATPSSSTLQYPKNIVYNNAGVYQVKLKVMNPTGADSMTKTNFITIIKPGAISITGNSNSTFNKVDTYSVANNAGSTYRWTVTGGTQLTGTNTNSITLKWDVVANGKVQVQETASTGCKGDSISITVPLVANAGIAETNELQQLKIYPNPASELLNIEFENPAEQNLEISLVSIVGQKIFNENIAAASGHFSKNINVSELSKGLYFIEVKSDSGTRQIKVMIE